MNFVIYAYDMLLLFLPSLSLSVLHYICFISSTLVMMHVYRSSMAKKCYARSIRRVAGMSGPGVPVSGFRATAGSQFRFTLMRERDTNS